VPAPRRLPAWIGALCLLASACSGRPEAKPRPDTGGAAPRTREPAPAPAPSDPDGPAADPAPAAADPAPDPAPAKGRSGPLDARTRSILHETGPHDTLAPTPIHYVKTNEIRHDVWFPYVADLGGAYVGVGSDQNYTLMAVQKAELAFLLDIDERVAHLHHVYEALIEASPDPETLHRRWHADSSAESLALLERAFAGADPERRKSWLREYRAARETVWRHLKHVIRRERDGQATTWLSNPELYAHVRRLYLEDRIRVGGGDLTGPSTMTSYARAAEQLGAVVRVLYLSNAEEYFMYTAQFRANVAAFPVDERSVVLRTIYNKEWEHADSLWNYQVQPLLDFRARLADTMVTGRNTMLRRAEQIDHVLQRTTDVKGLSRLAWPAG
jgi:hypothetical protein